MASENDDLDTDIEWLAESLYSKHIATGVDPAECAAWAWKAATAFYMANPRQQQHLSADMRRRVCAALNQAMSLRTAINQCFANGLIHLGTKSSLLSLAQDTVNILAGMVPQDAYEIVRAVDQPKGD